MEHSPDGKAYLVAHGADINDIDPRGIWNDSWITGDQVINPKKSQNEVRFLSSIAVLYLSHLFWKKEN